MYTMLSSSLLAVAVLSAAHCLRTSTCLSSMLLSWTAKSQNQHRANDDVCMPGEQSEMAFVPAETRVQPPRSPAKLIDQL